MNSLIVVSLRAAELGERLEISCWLLVISLGLVKWPREIGEIMAENCFKSVAYADRVKIDFPSRFW